MKFNDPKRPNSELIIDDRPPHQSITVGEWLQSRNDCFIPPPGWYCTRKNGHEGPCAAKPDFTPNPKNHFRISMLKSGLRMIGYVVLSVDLRIGVGLLLISEFIGIAEELV